jgi:hypothetical protein
MKNTSDNNGTNTAAELVVHSSAFSRLTYIREKSLLIATWKELSKKLLEQSVKEEISRVLKCIDQYKVENVIVDARHYYFMDRVGLQQWINTSYVPKLMETGIKRYAFVLKDSRPDTEYEIDEDAPQVAYFTSMEDAMNWIK